METLFAETITLVEGTTPDRKRMRLLVLTSEDGVLVALAFLYDAHYL